MTGILSDHFQVICPSEKIDVSMKYYELRNVKKEIGRRIIIIIISSSSGTSSSGSIESERERESKKETEGVSESDRGS